MTDLQVSQPVFTLLLLIRFRATTLPAAMVVGTRGRIITGKKSEQTNQMMYNREEGVLDSLYVRRKSAAQEGCG
jgi:hypothetical protein